MQTAAKSHDVVRGKRSRLSAGMQSIGGCRRSTEEMYSFTHRHHVLLAGVSPHSHLSWQVDLAGLGDMVMLQVGVSNCFAVMVLFPHLGGGRTRRSGWQFYRAGGHLPSLTQEISFQEKEALQHERLIYLLIWQASNPIGECCVMRPVQSRYLRKHSAMTFPPIHFCMAGLANSVLRSSQTLSASTKLDAPQPLRKVSPKLV